jgi:Holliday junction resolvase
MDLPDVLVGGGPPVLDTPWAVELKSKDPDDGSIYVPSEEVDALLRFADAFDAEPLIGVRWDEDTTWYLDDPDVFYRTDAGSVRIDPDSRGALRRRIHPPDDDEEDD